MKHFNLTVFFAFFMFSSCKTTEILPGFKLYDAPNALDQPGRVYRLNEDKTDFLVEYLPVNPLPGNIVISEKEKRKSLKIGAILSFISKSSSVNANAGYNSDKVSNFNFKLKDAHVYKISDAELRTHYTAMKQRIYDDIRIFGWKNPKYFIVREAVTAKEIFIQTTKDVKNDAQFKANVESLINGNANVSWANSSKDEIKVTLKDGLFVFYKPEEIVLQTSAAGDVEVFVKPASEIDLSKLTISSK